MSEHHTQGRQGQGARHHRRYRSHSGRNHRQRMPRPDSKAESKPSLLKRVLAFFGFGKKKDTQQPRKKGKDEKKQAPPQRVRVAQTNSSKPQREGGKPAGKGRRRPASVPPTDQARLYVGNLSFEATESDLQDLFKGFGNVRSVEIIYNQRTFRSKGYAFVEMMQLADAQRAAEVLHGQPFMGRELMVSAASEKTERAEEDTAAPTPTPAPEPAPAPAPVSTPLDDEQEVAFGEEVVINLSPEPSGSETPAAAESAAETPAAEAPASEAQSA